MMNHKSLMILLLLAGAGFAPIGHGAGPEPVPEIRPGILQGYLSPDAYPDSLALLPAAPAEGSPAQALDEALNKRLLALQGTPRFDLAALDNDLSFPRAADTFSCALGMRITETDTPYLYQLLRRSLADAGLATYAAKNHYSRTRPFVVNKAPNSASEREQEMLAHDGSYPSGHTAIGWAWALILTSLVPDRADEILARGKAYGESRMVCNVHWPSDVAAGRTVGAAVVAVLQSNPDFQRDFAEAKREVGALRGENAESAMDCSMENAALAVGLYGQKSVD
jgi:acid phosphatase (class A)